MPNPFQFDVGTLAPESGFQPVPEGWYGIEIQQSELKTEKNNEFQRRVYVGKVIWVPPNGDQGLIDRKYFDGLRESQQFAGRHMELFCAVMGSLDAVRAAAVQGGGTFDTDWLNGRHYLAMVTVNGIFNNVNRRVPYTQENINLILAGQDPDPVTAAPPAAAPQAAAPAIGVAPVAPAVAAPAPVAVPPMAAPAAVAAAPTPPAAVAPLAVAPVAVAPPVAAAPVAVAPVAVPPGPPVPPTPVPGQ